MPLGIYSQPPPAELSSVAAFELEEGRLSEAGRVITKAINDAWSIARYIPGMPP